MEHTNKESSNEIELNNLKCTRFHVETVKGTDTNTAKLGCSCMEEGSITEMGCANNLRYLTREALPRLDNYRHIMSIQAAYRPTLDDLHEACSNIDENDGGGYKRGYSMSQQKSAQFGWVQGILIPNLLSMCSSILFLRFAWIIIQTGLVEGLLLVAVVGLINLITALSISAISTNGIVKEGGSYVMMSRSLGPEFGIPVGVVLLISNIGLCVMYITGLTEYVINLTDFCWLDCGLQDTRNLSGIVFIIFIIIAIVCVMYDSTRFACMKIQIVLFVIIVAAILDFVISSIFATADDVHKNSFSRFSFSILQENLFAKYPDEKNVEYNLLFSLFAIFYPSLSEFLTGVISSGHLKDPLKAIPKGTVLSVLSSVIFYAMACVIIAGSVLHTGVVAITLNNDTLSSVLPVCENHSCRTKTYELYFLIESMCQEKNLIRMATVIACVYCIFTNCVTAITSFKVLCTDASYPKSLKWFSSKTTTNRTAQAYLFTIVIAFAFLVPGKMNSIAQMVSILLLAAHTLINFSTFHISLIRPVGWRPTFKVYNMWISLLASILCLAIMFLINWIIALITIITILALYLAVSYQKPDVNWGSSTQAQTYHNALLSVQSLWHVEDHVKNYHPQVLVLSGLPSHRPPLVTFANLITKNVSLTICGHIHSGKLTYREQQEYTIKARNWLDFNRIKAFYTQVYDVSFEDGAKSLMQASGLGKLKPNILLMGYKNNWTTSSKTDLSSYFSIIHKALDSYLALCILRVHKGLDFSSLLIDHDQLGETMSRLESDFKPPYMRAKNRIPAECKRVTFLKADARFEQPTGNDIKKNENTVKSSTFKSDSYEDISISDIYRSKDGLALSSDILSRITQFQGKQKGTIDVWWLYDDGGLTLLIPHIISRRRSWSICKLRVFALASSNDPLEFEQRNMASLLAKFRIDYSDLTVFSDLMRKPQEETIAFYENLIKDFRACSEDNSSNERIVITDSDLSTMQDKTNRHLRLRELLLEHSQDANLVVMTLPIPRKSAVSAALYMSWLEALTEGMPPFLLVRGNQTSVLTFYS